jgi:hypothetical protein
MNLPGRVPGPSRNDGEADEGAADSPMAGEARRSYGCSTGLVVVGAYDRGPDQVTCQDGGTLAR